jgi:hypothetical protein
VRSPKSHYPILLPQGTSAIISGSPAPHAGGLGYQINIQGMERSEYKNIEPQFVEEAEAIAERHSGFTDGCRVLFLIQRHSDGGHTNNSKLRSYISRNDGEWLTACAKLLQEKAEYPDLPLRIYQSINARNIEKGIMHFKHAMLDADYYDDAQRQGFYLDVRNRIVSALMKPASAATSFFLWDCDTQDEAVLQPFRAELQRLSNIVHEYPSKSGIHIITGPFNPNLVQPPANIEFKKDAVMLLKY